jgi:hypothetical protein
VNPDVRICRRQGVDADRHAADSYVHVSVEGACETCTRRFRATSRSLPPTVHQSPTHWTTAAWERGRSPTISCDRYREGLEEEVVAGIAVMMVWMSTSQGIRRSGTESS